MKTTFNVAIVGATGLIGRKFIEVLENRNFPIKSIKLFASKKSVGKKLVAFEKEITVQEPCEGCFECVDLAFFSAGKNVSSIYAPIAVNEGAYVIDNSSAFRKNPKIPLVIPEINGEVLQNTNSRLIANPNCSTAIGILPIKTLDNLFGVKRIIYTSYQAVSGCGKQGLNDLTNCKLGFNSKLFGVDVSKNFIPKIGNYTIFGYTEEELKMIEESKKILDKDIPISATCVRVPIENCHGVSVEVELEKNFFDEDIKSIFRQIKGVTLCDLPLPQNADCKDEVLVGRIKRSLAFKNGISYFCVGDNTLKGASLNAVQIAERLILYNKLQ